MPANRLLFIGEETGFTGGIERYAFQTAAILRAHDFQVDWCGKHPGRNEAEFKTGFDAVLTIPEALERAYDLAILHKLPADLPELEKWRRKFGEKLIFWAHDHDLYCPRRHYYTPFGRVNCHRPYAPWRCNLCAAMTSPRNWKYRRSDGGALLRELRRHRAVVLSNFMRQNLLGNGFSPQLVRVIPPVLELPPPPPVDAAPDMAKPLNLLFLGQFIRGKGADLFLEALGHLTFPWRACLAGDGKDRDKLRRTVKARHWENLVAFPGWLADPGKAISSCDVAVFPSRWQEPFGLAGAEAAAYGKPVVAFDVGGVREWLRDGVNGFVVPERDAKALANKLDRLYREPDLRLKMGASGRTLAQERFSERQFLDRFKQLLSAGGCE